MQKTPSASVCPVGGRRKQEPGLGGGEGGAPQGTTCWIFKPVGEALLPDQTDTLHKFYWNPPHRGSSFRSSGQGQRILTQLGKQSQLYLERGVSVGGWH